MACAERLLVLCVCTLVSACISVCREKKKEESSKEKAALRELRDRSIYSQDHPSQPDSCRTPADIRWRAIQDEADAPKAESASKGAAEAKASRALTKPASECSLRLSS